MGTFKQLRGDLKEIDAGLMPVRSIEKKYGRTIDNLRAMIAAEDVAYELNKPKMFRKELGFDGQIPTEVLRDWYRAFQPGGSGCGRGICVIILSMIEELLETRGLKP